MSNPIPGFQELDLAPPLARAVADLGYETPLPIQAACIPPMLAGQDVMGLAQTGTGKTAAFALPLMSRIDLSLRAPQVLVLTPTRELANQVAEAFQAYARHLPEFHVLPIYGGQRYPFQFSQLHRGPHVVVGTPGRIQDHLDRGSLKLDNLFCLVLDEADEMLRMGFVEAVEAIMERAPSDRQTALFSATMPAQIRRISKRYLHDAAEIRITGPTATAANIEQVYLVVPNAAKIEVLVRILETESYDGIIIFARTRVATTELAEKLAARGFNAAPLNGDMNQIARERTVKRLKNGQVDIVVATDVAARGLDVERISLVINFDIPGGSEAYVHRIGRTGRVGRYGKAILFATPRERHLLKTIERVTRQPLTRMELPSHDAVTSKRVEKFQEDLTEIMAAEPMEFFQDLSFELMETLNIDVLQLAAGLLCLAQKDRPLRAENNINLTNPRWDESRVNRRDRGQRPSPVMVLYRLDVGSEDRVEVRNIVGAVTHETGIKNRFIGQIRIHPQYSTIELPADMPPHLIKHLRNIYVANKQLNIAKADGSGPDSGEHRNFRPRKARPSGPTKPKKPKAKRKKAKKKSPQKD